MMPCAFPFLKLRNRSAGPYNKMTLNCGTRKLKMEVSSNDKQKKKKKKIKKKMKQHMRQNLSIVLPYEWSNNTSNREEEENQVGWYSAVCMWFWFFLDH